MPKVGKKKFPYTNKGVADAKKYAKENDLPIIWTEDAKSGMAVPGYAEGGGVRFYEAQKSQGGGGLDLYQPTTMSGMGVGGGSKGAATEEEQQYESPEETTTEETPTDEPELNEEGEPMSPIEDRFENEEQEEEFYKDMPGDEDKKGVQQFSPIEDRFEDDEQKKEFFKDMPKEDDKESSLGKMSIISDKSGDKGEDKSPLSNISIISDKSKDKGEGLFAGSDKGSGESLTDKIKDKTSGGGTNPLEAIKDEVSAKKGAVVKVNKKKRKLNKGGKMNKKGMAVVIAIGRPKVNRKKR